MKAKKAKRRDKKVNNKLNIPYQTVKKIRKGQVVYHKEIAMMRRTDHELSKLEKLMMELVMDSLMEEEDFIDMVGRLVGKISDILGASFWYVFDVSGENGVRFLSGFGESGMTGEELLNGFGNPKDLKDVRSRDRVVVIPLSIEKDTVLVIVLGLENDIGITDERIFDMIKEKLENVLKNSMKLRKMFEERFRDHLTGVLNRKALERDLRDLKDFSAIFLDVDDFKGINDEFGHRVGDEILKSLAEEIRKSLRSSDRVYRYGGDEFVIVLPRTDLDTARSIAARLADAVSRISINGIRISISTGVASSVEGSSILELADERMYSRKRKKVS